MFDSKTQSLKLSVSEDLWRRLRHYAQQAGLPEEDAVIRLLDRHLPNLTGSLARTIERLSPEERRVLQNSFYTIVYLVGYADKEVSFKEGLKMDQGIKKLQESFGEELVRLIELPKAEQEKLFKKIKESSTEEVILTLLEIRGVFKKLPEQLATEYKFALFDSGLAIAEASGEKLFGEKVSSVERQVLFSILYLLEIKLDRHPQFFEKDLSELQALQLWKANQKEKIQ